MEGSGWRDKYSNIVYIIVLICRIFWHKRHSWPAAVTTVEYSHGTLHYHIHSESES